MDSQDFNGAYDEKKNSLSYTNANPFEPAGEIYRSLSTPARASDLSAGPVFRSVGADVDYGSMGADMMGGMGMGGGMGKGMAFDSFAPPPPALTSSFSDMAADMNNLHLGGGKNLGFSGKASGASAGFGLAGLSQAAYVPDQIQPPEVPGGYLEPSYHVHSQSNAYTLLQSVSNHLTNAQVDFIVKHNKFKVKCVSYRGGARVTFIVRVFSVGTDASAPRYAIECQRRSGCIMHFSEIYHALTDALNADGLLEDSQLAALTGSSLFAPPKLDALDSAVTVEQGRETLGCLLQMVDSPCSDVKSEAIAAMVDLASKGDKIQALIVSEGGLEKLVAELECAAEDVHRNAARGVAQLTSNNKNVCEFVHANGGLKSLYGLAASPVVQVVRESASALANIGSALGSQFLDQDFFNTINALSSYPDMHARQEAQRVSEILA
jgi:hypothetical protein